MKIVIASGIYPPDIGGPATYSRLIAREFIKRGIDATVICYSDEKKEFIDQEEKFEILRILRRHNILFRYWLYFWSLFKLAKNKDVIYAQGPLAAGFPAMLVSKILKKKFVIKIVGDYAWEQGVNQFRLKDLIEPFQSKEYNFKVELIRKMQKLVVKKADKIIVPSEFLKKIVSEWGINPGKIFVVYNSAPEVKDIKGDLKIGGDIIVSGGRLEPWKGMDTLIEIMPDLLRENSNFKLVIIGYGPERDNLKFKIKNLKLENEVRLIDRLPHRELLEYFKTSKIFVLNSGYEGFSHLLLEAMAVGLPIITTNVCGNPEIVKDGYNGLLIDYNNKTQLKEAILRLWRDEDLQRKFSENGKRTVANFTSEKMINETINALNLKDMPAKGGSASGGKLLMITGDRALASGKKGPFYYMLEEFSKYWERIDIICPKTEQKVSNLFQNVYIHVSDKSLIFHPFFILKRGLEIYKKEKFDLFTIHSYPPFYNDIGGFWLYNKIRIPYILEIMHITGYPKAAGFKELLYRNLTKIFVKFFSKKAKAVRVINQKQTTEFLVESGINRDKIRYIPAFYIDFEIFKPFDLEKKYDLVFSGRLARNKGIFLLLEAVNNLKFKIKNLKLIIIGDGPLKPKIQKFIKDNNLQDNMIFAGWLPGTEDVAKVYNQSKIMVMPSLNEGGPRVNFEAMACKVPVVTTRVGAMIDVIKDRENGLFIDWDAEDIAKKIIELLKDDDLRKKIAENGYHTVQQFEKKKAIENYAKTYQNLLHSTRI